MKKNRADFNLNCLCGAKSPVFESKGKWFSHCISCGMLVFWSNPALSERAKYGGVVCNHKPQLEVCKGGKTSFCKICRVRIFVPNKE